MPYMCTIQATLLFCYKFDHALITYTNHRLVGFFFFISGFSLIHLNACGCGNIIKVNGLRKFMKWCILTVFLSVDSILTLYVLKCPNEVFLIITTLLGDSLNIKLKFSIIINDDSIGRKTAFSWHMQCYLFLVKKTSTNDMFFFSLWQVCRW